MTVLPPLSSQRWDKTVTFKLEELNYHMESWLTINFSDQSVGYNQGTEGKPKRLVVADYIT